MQEKEIAIKEKKEFDNTIDTELELKKKFIDIHTHSISDEVSSDYTLARLDLKDKEAIIEMIQNAYLFKRVLLLLRDKSKRYVWSEEENGWEITSLTEIQKEKINHISRKIFAAITIRPHITTILNRNIELNYLIKTLMYEEDTKKEEDIKEEKTESLLQKVKKKISKKKEEEE